MNIIVIPGKVAKGHNISLGHGHIVVIALALLVLLPAVLGVTAYKISNLFDRAELRDPEYLLAQERKLVLERESLTQARENAEANLQALAFKLGEMQAQVVRLNALGGRLSHLAGLDKAGEFNFNETPAVGGPENVSLGKVMPAEVIQSLAALSITIDDRADRLAHLESVLLDRKVRAVATPAGWPVEGGWMSSGFGIRTDPFTGHQARHEGVDIAMPLGSKILALGAGVVIHAGLRSGYGLTVEVNHGRGQVTRYAHAQEVLVKEGDRVVRNQPIALVGSSGRSTGPHLHLELLQDGRAVDPRTYLTKN